VPCPTTSGARGKRGHTGAQGPAGPQGPAGEGVPGGGDIGQVLTKVGATDYATAWTSIGSTSDMNPLRLIHLGY